MTGTVTALWSRYMWSTQARVRLTVVQRVPSGHMSMTLIQQIILAMVLADNDSTAYTSIPTPVAENRMEVQVQRLVSARCAMSSVTAWAIPISTIPTTAVVRVCSSGT